MRRAPPLAALLLLLPAAAFAHTGIGAQGAPLAAGFAHPFLGADHLLTMVAVGLLAALTGGRARWAYPGAFVGTMIAGGLIGFGGAPLPAVEPTILASVVLLGGAILLAVRPPLLVACGAIAVFGLAHGYAHGLEAPGLGGPAYAAGFVAATAILHAAGLGIGASRPAARAVGGLTAAAGLVLAFAG